MSQITNYRTNMFLMLAVAIINLVMYITRHHDGLNLAAGLFGLAMAGWYLYLLRQELRRVRR